MQQLLAMPLVLRWALTLAFLGLIVALSVAPGKSQYGDSTFVWLVEHTPSLVQNIMHVACYAGATALLAWSLEGIGSRTARVALAAILALLIGTVLEWYQTQVPGRFGTILDVALNAAGVGLGIVVALLLF